jgi:hypothetical protein
MANFGKTPSFVNVFVFFEHNARTTAQKVPHRMTYKDTGAERTMHKIFIINLMTTTFITLHIFGVFMENQGIVTTSGT